MARIEVCAAILGIVSHVTYFLHGEHHRTSPPILLTSLCIFLALLLVYWTQLDGGILSAVANTVAALSCYSVSLFTSIVVYRVCFHRLNAFPGPFLAKWTKLWHVVKLLPRADNHHQLEILRQDYGDFVRTGSRLIPSIPKLGPNEVTIFKPEAVPALYGPRSSCTKSDWYDILFPMFPLNMIRDRALHNKRRRVWNHALSVSALHDYEIHVREYALKLEKKIANCQGTAVNAALYFEYFSFDVMGKLGFGKSFNLLEGEETHHAVETLRAGMRPLGYISPAPWLFSLASCIPGALNKWKYFCKWCTQQMRARIETGVDNPDVTSWLLDASEKHSSLEKDKKLLEGDSILLVIAGSDTTSGTLTHLFYHLAKDAAQTRKLREELMEIPNIFDQSALSSLCHLNGVINETLRLHPPVPAGLLRTTPPEGITVTGRYIPGDVTVVAPAYSIQRLESCFERAPEFLPERWYSEINMVRNKDAFAPFSIGPYNCVGKNLALMELRTVTALLVSRFDIEFAPGEDGTKLFEDSGTFFTVAPGPLRLVFTPRMNATEKQPS